MQVGQVFVKLGLDMGDFTSQLVTAEGAVKRFGANAKAAFLNDVTGASNQGRNAMGQFTGAAQGLSGALGGILKQAAGFALAQVGVSAIGEAIKGAVMAGIDWNASLETSNAKWTTLLGSQSAAIDQLNWMKAIAAETPFEFAELDTAASRMKAFGFSVEQSRALLLTLGDAAAATGTGSEGINRLALALGQIQGKGKLATQELNQMGEMGIPVFKMLAEGMNVSEAKLRDMVEKGLVPANKAIPILEASMRKMFDGAMQKQAETFTGRMSTLKDNMKNMLGDAAKPLFEYLTKTAMPTAISLVDKMSKGLKTGGIQGAIAAIFPDSARQGVMNLMKAIGLLIDILKEVGTAVAPAAKAALAGVWQLISVAFGWIVQHGELVKNLIEGIAIAFVGYQIITTITKWIQAWQAAQWGLNLALNANPIGVIIVLIGLLIAAGIAIVKNWDVVKRTTLNAWGAIKEAIYSSIAWILDKYAEFIGIFDKEKAAAIRANAEKARAIGKQESALVDQRNDEAERNAQYVEYAEARKAAAAAEAAKAVNDQSYSMADTNRNAFEDMAAAGDASMADQVKNAKKTKEAKIQYLDEFDKAFGRSQDYQLGAFKRRQEDEATRFQADMDARKAAFAAYQEQEQKTLEANQQKRMKTFEAVQQFDKDTFKMVQDHKLNNFKAAQDAEKTVFQRTQQDELDTFKTSQGSQKDTFQRLQEDKLTAFKGQLDSEKTAYERHQQDMLDSFKNRQDGELRALKDRQDGERRALDSEYDRAMRALEKQEKDLNKQKEQSDRGDRLKSADDKIGKAKHTLDVANISGSAGDIAKAQSELAAAQQEKQRLQEDYARQDQLGGIKDQKDALKDQYDQSKQSMADRQKAEEQTLKDQQDVKLKQYQRQLEDQKIAWEGQQAAKLTQYQREQDDQKVQFEALQAAALTEYQRQQDDEKTKYETKQAAKLTQFEQVLTDEADQFNRVQDQAHTQFEVQLAAEKKALDDRQQVAKTHFEAVLQDWDTHFKRQQEDAQTAYKNQLDDLKDSFSGKLTEQRQFVNDWNAKASEMASMTPPAGGSTTFTASTSGSDMPAFATGGIVSKPTVGLIGEAGPEAIVPLSWLSRRLVDFAANVAGSLQMPSIPNLGSGPPRMGAAGAATGSARGNNGPQQVVIPVYLDGKQIAEHTVDLAFGGLRQVARAMGG